MRTSLNLLMKTSTTTALIEGKWMKPQVVVSESIYNIQVNQHDDIIS